MAAWKSEFSGLQLPPHTQSLIQRWAERDPELAAVAAIWLELDYAPKAPLPSPIICVRLQAPWTRRWLSESFLTALLGRAPQDSEVDFLNRAVATMPANADLLYLFDLSARGGSFRLEVYCQDLQTVSNCFDAWALNGARLPRSFQLLDDCDRYHLSADFDGRGLGPRIGLEASMVKLPAREPRWRDLLDRLVDTGLCRPEHVPALLAWPGYDTRSSAPNRWPSEAPGYCVRALSHVKLVTWPDREPEAKVYLLFQPVARRSDLRQATSKATSQASPKAIVRST